MRKNLPFTVLLVLLLSAPLLAQPDLRITDCSANAQGDVRRPVTLDVTVTNQGKEQSPPGIVTVKCTPKVTSDLRGKGGMLDPMDFRGQVPPLAPGQKQTVTMSTPYESNSAYKGRHGSFRASNLSPTGEITVDFSGTVQMAQPRP